MSKAKELFDKYQEAHESVLAARQALETAMSARSQTVKQIVDTLGEGPFQWQGEMVKATKRQSKDENGTVTGISHFFKSVGKSLQVIE